MIGKLCAAPAKGGAASGLIEYLVGYAISEKGATRQEIADALDGVYAESEQRRDLAVDAVWRPEAGGGRDLHLYSCGTALRFRQQV
jgi:hypothetical protein